MTWPWLTRLADRDARCATGARSRWRARRRAGCRCSCRSRRPSRRWTTRPAVGGADRRAGRDGDVDARRGRHSQRAARRTATMIGPLTGQIRPPEPCWIGPRRRRRSRAQAGPGPRPARAGASATSSSSAWRSVARAGQQLRLGRARAPRSASRRSTSWPLTRGDLRRPRPRSPRRPSPRASRACRAARRWRSRPPSRPARRPMMRASCVGDALHELGALEQVGEAVGLEHDGDDVGRVGLVELDEPLGERARASASRARSRASRSALAPQVLLDLGELRALGRPGRLEADLLALELRDVGLQGVDPVRVNALTLGGQHALAALAAGRSARACDRSCSGSSSALWPLEPSGSTAQRASGSAATRTRRLSRRPMRRAMLGALRRRYQRSAPRYGACNESCRMQGFSANARRAGHVICPWCLRG